MTFEDEFSEKQKDILSLTLEYVEKIGSRVDGIYIYCSVETFYTFNMFYRIDDKVLKKHQIVTEIVDENELDNLVFSVLELGNNDLRDLHKICLKHNKPMPTQIKIVYNNVDKKVHANYSYDLFYSNSATLTPSDIFNQWYDEIRKEVES